MKTTLVLFSSCLLAAGGLMMNTTNLSVVENEKSAPVFEVQASQKRASSAPLPPMYIVIDKRKYELSVYDAKGWFATYPVVFGNRSLDDKRMEGDRNTPEGEFKINSKRVHSKWDRFMGIDYPNQASLEKFNRRKKRGEIPSNASPGGAIGIHGTWPNEDFVVDRFDNWTLGCISLKRHDVRDLYSYIPVGTPVVIRK